ncbi:MAG: molybdate ABC transporter permease subunit [Kordiimonas sp.]
MFTAVEIEALSLSLKVAFWATLLALPLAISTAYFLSRRHFRGKFLIETIIHIPLVVPPVVVGYLLLITLAPTSYIGSLLSSAGISPAFKWQGAAIASGVMAFPLMVRSIRQAFDAEPIHYSETAETLGIPKSTHFWRVSLPLAYQGILSGTVLGFARAIGEFGATITFAANIPGLTQTLPLALYSAAQAPGGETPAARLALLCLIPALASLAASEWLSRRMKSKMSSS